MKNEKTSQQMHLHVYGARIDIAFEAVALCAVESHSISWPQKPGESYHG
mgnify:CR=1 FL=1